MKGRNSMAGGFLIALGVIAGALWGAIEGEPSLGVLIGAAVGAIAAALVWLVERRRG